MDCLKKSGGGDSASLLRCSENGCGDFIVLPPKKNKELKRKKIKQVHDRKPKLSDSQKRKLKKLKEDKEKKRLLSGISKTLELEQHKIPKDVYSFTLSSTNLGQVETDRGKRRLEFQCDKSGLELPHFDKPNKKIKIDTAFQDHEVQQDDTRPQAVNEYDRSSLTEVVMQDLSDIDGVQSDKEMTSETIQPFTQPLKKSTDSCPSNQEIVQSIKKVERYPESGDTGVSNRNCSSVRNFSTPTVVHVSRPEELEKQREDLPIVMMEQEIMEAINENSTVIISGKTGCGKTTQVPQILYEAGYGNKNSKTRGGIIGVTQPRRVAVLATARRVAFELGVPLGEEVGFQVRHDRKFGEKSSIKFMTDGILLREVQSDFLLRRYSVIILDEVHERSLNTDILVGMLSRVIQNRQKIYEDQQKWIRSGKTIDCQSRIHPLKLVLMSATLCEKDFVSDEESIFCDPPPVINVPTRQYPVTIHFSKKTEVDYVDQAYKKVLSIHKRLPRGGILVFVTGQREVENLCKRLRCASLEIVKRAAKRNNEAYPIPDGIVLKENDMKEVIEACEFQGTYVHDITERFGSYMEEDQFNFLEDELETSHASVPDGFTQQEADVNPSNSISKPGLEEEKGLNVGSLRVLPLYAMLPALDQLRVFEETKEGERLVVVATNVAETSLTIPGVKYVVDTGREKVKTYNSSNGMETYEVQWISKASARQREGRAGRTGPGHCYRLYSSAVFDDKFPEFSVAEISKVPVDSVVLLMKSMNIGKVKEFPFPTRPTDNALDEAESRLKDLGALDGEGMLTSLGKAMARYPMSPRHSRMLLTVIQLLQKENGVDRPNLVLGFAVAAAAALSLLNPFVIEFGGSHRDSDDNANTGGEVSGKEENKLRNKNVKASREKFFNPTSDALTIARALQCFENESKANRSAFCSKYALHYKTMEEMSKLRKQLLQLVFSSSSSDLQQDFSWNHGRLEEVEGVWGIQYDKPPLQLIEEKVLRQAICAGWADRVAKRIKGRPILVEGKKNVNAARYQTCTLNETVFLHRSLSISKSPPEFLVYTELLLTNRPYIQGATSVEPTWLPQYARSRCTFSAPLPDRKPYYNPTTDQVLEWVSPSFGKHLWPLPPCCEPVKDDLRRATAFANCLLEGHVLPCLKRKDVQQYLAESPARMLKPEGACSKRAVNLLSKLKRRGRVIDSCGKLREVWKKNPFELYVEILAWFQKACHAHFPGLWVEMQRQALLHV